MPLRLRIMPLIALTVLVGCGGAIPTATPIAPRAPASAPSFVTPAPGAPIPATSAPTPPSVTESPVSKPAWLQGSWKTNVSRRTVDLREIRSGGPPRDGIPPIDKPKFIAARDADAWLKDNEPVIAFANGGEIRAYPLQILTWHEIVNDVVGGTPVTITFCPLCNTAIAYDRTLDSTVYDFGTSGLLRDSNLVMWDRQTETLWQQLTGEGIIGDLAGRVLTRLPASIISYGEFKASYPAGSMVLSRDTGAKRSYGTNPYSGYDDAHQSPFLFDGPIDKRLPPMERVVTVQIGTEYVAYPYASLEQKRVVNDTVGGKPIVVVWKRGTASALDKDEIADSRDIGATAVYDVTLEGRALTFAPLPDATNEPGAAIFRDTETGSGWTLTGTARSGPLAGKQLTPIIHGDEFWFVWAAFLPTTAIRQ